MMFNNIFATYLYSKKLDINLTSLKKHILQTQRNDEKGVHLSNLGGWQSQGFKNPMSSNKSLFKSLDLIAKEIKDTVGYTYDLELNHYWYNINYSGSYNIPHSHVGLKNDNIISGVFYVETFPNSGRLVFNRNNPLISVMHAADKSYNEYNSSMWNVAPYDNLCVLFPAHLQHYVETNLNTSDRFSISFNYSKKNTK